MNEQLIKTLEALSVCEHELQELFDQMEALEMRMQVPFDYVEMVCGYIEKVEKMTKSITKILSERENKKLQELKEKKTAGVL